MTRECEDRGISRPGDRPDMEFPTPSSQLVLVCLCRHGGTSSLIRLAHDIATQWYGPSPSPARVRDVYRRLYNDYLHTLVASGLVEYSVQDGSVTLA
jgi:hypothetical protein